MSVFFSGTPLQRWGIWLSNHASQFPQGDLPSLPMVYRNSVLKRSPSFGRSRSKADSVNRKHLHINLNQSVFVRDVRAVREAVAVRDACGFPTKRTTSTIATIATFATVWTIDTNCQQIRSDLQNSPPSRLSSVSSLPSKPRSQVKLHIQAWIRFRFGSDSPLEIAKQLRNHCFWKPKQRHFQFQK